jgi:hypothetical protein
MSTESLLDAIVKHMDSLQSITSWAVLLAAGIFIAGVVRGEKINVFGTELKWTESGQVVGGIYLGVTVYAAVLFLKMERLFSRIEDPGALALAVEKFSHHPWIFNPYSSYGRDGVGGVVLDHLGIAFSWIIWVIAFYSLVRFAAHSRSIMAMLITAQAFAVGFTLYAIVRIYRILDAKVDSFLRAPVSDQQRKLAIEWLQRVQEEFHAPMGISVLAILLGAMVGLALVVMAEHHRPRGAMPASTTPGGAMPASTTAGGAMAASTTADESVKDQG